MPLSKRQFELGINEEIEKYMHGIYKLLSRYKDSAYSAGELGGELLSSERSNNAHSVDSNHHEFQRALNALVLIGAIEKRQLKGEDYYAFYQKVDTKSWASKVKK